jgi:hypothetical protein
LLSCRSRDHACFAASEIGAIRSFFSRVSFSFNHFSADGDVVVLEVRPEQWWTDLRAGFRSGQMTGSPFRAGRIPIAADRIRRTPRSSLRR